MPIFFFYSQQFTVAHRKKQGVLQHPAAPPVPAPLPMLSMSNTEMLIHAFMTSRLNYCNALFGGCSARLINKLQMVQNTAARVLTRTRKYDHISPVLSTLNWLPIKHHIDFKILLITYKALNGLAPQYLSELLSHYSPPRPLRSQNSGHLIIPRISKSTAGGRSFFYLALEMGIFGNFLFRSSIGFKND